MLNVEDELRQAISDAVIRRLAGAQSYQRGRDYFSHGRVESYTKHGMALAGMPLNAFDSR